MWQSLDFFTVLDSFGKWSSTSWCGHLFPFPALGALPWTVSRPAVCCPLSSIVSNLPAIGCLPKDGRGFSHFHTVLGWLSGVAISYWTRFPFSCLCSFWRLAPVSESNMNRLTNRSPFQFFLHNSLVWSLTKLWACLESILLQTCMSYHVTSYPAHPHKIQKSPRAPVFLRPLWICLWMDNWWNGWG